MLSGHARMFIADKSPSLPIIFLPLIVLRSILFSHSIVKYHKFNVIVWLSKSLFFLSLIDTQLLSYHITLVHPRNFTKLPSTQHGCCSLSLNHLLAWLMLELLFPYLHTQLGLLQSSINSLFILTVFLSRLKIITISHAHSRSLSFFKIHMTINQYYTP